MRLMKLALVSLVLALLLPACGGNSPTAPSVPTATLPPAGPVVLTGSVTHPGGPVVGGTVTILDGANSGRSTMTNTAGAYRFDDLAAGNANISASSRDHEERRAGITLQPGMNNLNFSTRTLLPWSLSGSGNTVFDMPRYFARVRIQGRWGGFSNSNFIVRIGGRLVVNEILRQSITYDGTHLTNGGGVVEITNSVAISWTFTEVR